MSLCPLTLGRRTELEAEAGPTGLYLATALADKAHEAIKGFPASSPVGRSAICQLAADDLICAAAQAIGVEPDELPDNDREEDR